MAESPLKAWKSSYVSSVQEIFRGVEDHASCLRQVVGLESRYPKLRPMKVHREEDGTIPYSGCLLEQAEVTKSSDRTTPSSVQDLFVDGRRMVVLVGPPGIGKTTTAQKVVLDWSTGSLYGDRFNFVFYVSGRDINKINGNVDISGLVAKGSVLQCSENLAKSAFNDPSKVLLVLDGFDELKWTLEEDYEDYEDPFQETHKETFLRCLLGREILGESSLLIMTRSMSLQKMNDLAKPDCSVEVLGFSEGEVNQYFHRFFKNKNEVDKALSVLRDNKVLLGLCSIPLTCWLVCTILKAGVKPLGLANCKTLTSVYLLYLKSLLTDPVNQLGHGCLKKLCALANEGIQSQKSLFDEEDLGRYGVTMAEVASVFPNDRLFQRDVEASTAYSFIHLSLQDFLAAMYYVLGDEAEVKENSGLSGDTFLPKVCKGKSLSYQAAHQPYLSTTVQFLFGLLHDEQLKELASRVGFNASLRAKPAMEKWLTAERPSIFCLEMLCCFYEAQDEELRRGAFGGQDLVFEPCIYSSTMENVPIREMLYCLKDRESFGSLRLADQLITPKDLALLAPLFHGSSKVCFTRCGFAEDSETGGAASWMPNPSSKIQELEFHVCVVTPPFFEDLRALISSSQLLTRLVLSHHKLENSALKTLCDGLRQPSCRLWELLLDDCNLTAPSCEILGSAIKENRSLRKLDLTLNKVEDEGVKFICEGLKDPACSLQELRIEFAELTPACCEDFSSVLLTNRSLTTLYIRESNIQDPGAKVLCEAIQQPGCTLKELGLYENNLSSSSCEGLQSVLTTLTSLDLTYNNLQDSGVKLLCEGLCEPGCTLQDLLLTHCELTPASCAEIRLVLITNRSLTRLELTWNSLKDSGVKLLCEGLKDPACALQELSLHGCDLTSASLQEFSSVLRTNQSLTKLELSGNQYDSLGVTQLCEALCDPGCNLQTFRVGYCEMTSSCADQFLAVINTSCCLRELDVSFGYEDVDPPADLSVMCQRFKHPACTLEISETQDGTFIYFKYKKPE